MSGSAACGVVAVFPTSVVRHSGYNAGLGWFGGDGFGTGAPGATKSATHMHGNNWNTVRIRVDQYGLVRFYLNGVLKRSEADNTYTSGIIRLGNNCQTYQYKNVLIHRAGLPTGQQSDPSLARYAVVANATTPCNHVSSLRECASAATKLGLAVTTPFSNGGSSSSYPAYCHTGASGNLKFNSGGNTGSCSKNDRCVCKVDDVNPSIQVSSVKVYTDALSHEDVRAMYAAGRAGDRGRMSAGSVDACAPVTSTPLKTASDSGSGSWESSGSSSRGGDRTSGSGLGAWGSMNRTTDLLAEHGTTCRDSNEDHDQENTSIGCEHIVYDASFYSTRAPTATGVPGAPTSTPTSTAPTSARTHGSAFFATLGPKNGVSGHNYTFTVHKPTAYHKSLTNGGSYSTFMVDECNKLGMKPVCEHPTYCKTDAAALYIGQSGHIANPGSRNYNSYNPSGWSTIKQKWQGLCVYAGGHQNALCNIPTNTHGWKSPMQSNPGFVCGKINRAKSCHDVVGASLRATEVERCAPDSSRHEVVCCSDKPLTGYAQRTCNDRILFAASDAPGFGGCQNASNYTHAVKLCASMGARLCTRTEIASQCIADVGCNHSLDMVWASTGELKADTPRVAVLFDGLGANTSHVPPPPPPPCSQHLLHVERHNREAENAIITQVQK